MPTCRSARSPSDSAPTACRCARTSAAAAEGCGSSWVTTMSRLRDRFATLDGVAAPNVWADAQRRAADDTSIAVTRPQIAWRDRQLRTGLIPVLAILLLAALLTLTAVFV